MIGVVLDYIKHRLAEIVHNTILPLKIKSNFYLIYNRMNRNVIDEINSQLCRDFC